MGCKNDFTKIDKIITIKKGYWIEKSIIISKKTDIKKSHSNFEWDFFVFIKVVFNTNS
jgi:hypothetical protein